jgi:hypothetical protein
MRTLDSDFKIIKELETNGESKQIIYAMISNLQTRISFAKCSLHIEKTLKIKTISDEKNNLNPIIILIPFRIFK